MSRADGPSPAGVLAAVLVAGTALAAVGMSWAETAPWHPPARDPAVAAQAVPAPVPVPGSSAAPGVPSGTHDADATPSSTATPVAGVIAPGADPARSARDTAAPTWTAAVASSTGIPTLAVQAYADATLALATEQPGCRLGWTTVAALGAVESGHGTHDDATLGPDGRPSAPVVGPALDGTHGTRAIRATAAGTGWHGDTVWEHAVGPMQFLPGTWQRWGADGDGDGTADPHDLADAALAAARYLCADARDLGTATGWRAAVFSYNHDDAYVTHVLELADAYADAATPAP